MTAAGSHVGSEMRALLVLKKEGGQRDYWGVAEGNWPCITSTLCNHMAGTDKVKGLKVFQTALASWQLKNRHILMQGLTSNNVVLGIYQTHIAITEFTSSCCKSA